MWWLGWGCCGCDGSGAVVVACAWKETRRWSWHDGNNRLCQLSHCCQPRLTARRSRCFSRIELLKRLTTAVQSRDSTMIVMVVIVIEGARVLLKRRRRTCERKTLACANGAVKHAQWL